MAALVVIGLAWTGKKGYETIQRKRARRKARKVAISLPLDPEDDHDETPTSVLSVDDPPGYALSMIASNPTADSIGSDWVSRDIHFASPTLEAGARLNTVRVLRRGGVTTVSRASIIISLSTPGNLVLEDDVRIAHLTVGGSLTCGARCDLGDVQLTRDLVTGRAVSIGRLQCSGNITAASGCTFGTAR